MSYAYSTHKGYVPHSSIIGIPVPTANRLEHLFKVLACSINIGCIIARSVTELSNKFNLTKLEADARERVAYLLDANHLSYHIKKILRHFARVPTMNLIH